MTDFYAQTSAHVAAVLVPAWEGPALARELAGRDTQGLPLVDVGAGTGLGVRVVAGALHAAEILAVEPGRGRGDERDRPLHPARPRPAVGTARESAGPGRARRAQPAPTLPARHGARDADG